MTTATGSVRGTQSFMGTLTTCWRRPVLTALEVAWRWLYGAPALVLVLHEMRIVLMAATGGTMNPARLGLDTVLLNDPIGALSGDPLGASVKFANALSLVWSGVAGILIWLVPLLVAGWVLVSSVGRTLVLKRADAAMHVRIGTLMVLQTIRVLSLAAVFWAWFAAIGWASRIAVTEPIAQQAEPNLVLYCGLVIVTTLGLFCGWAVVSWVVGIAPLLAMQMDMGVAASLRAAVRLGPVRGKLVEINLVLGIVKIALIVLAMVFSATPLPFQSVTSAEFLAWWWAGVTVLYIVWSDFFHVARLVGYLQLWRGSGEQATTDAVKTDKNG